jgi:hypothetical protein
MKIRALDRHARTSIIRRALCLVAAPLVSLLVPSQRLVAQGWITEQQRVIWVNAALEAPITQRTSISLDGSSRFAGVEHALQTLLVRPGIQHQLTDGVRVSAGYAYLASIPLPSQPSGSPVREHRSWQQALVSHTLGRFSIGHRYRLEQRWSHSLLKAEAQSERIPGPTSYQNRSRYLLRAATPLPAVTWRGRALTIQAWGELLGALGGPTQSATLVQDRVGAGVGIPLSAETRLEVSYLRLHNIHQSRATNEVNHTTIVGWQWTRAPKH